MAHTITLDDTTYASLQTLAKRQHRQPEEVVRTLIADAQDPVNEQGFWIDPMTGLPQMRSAYPIDAEYVRSLQYE